MAFQFVHLETYSRKPDAKGRNCDFIFDEVTRQPSASIHVPNPKNPVLLFGADVEEVKRIHDQMASQTLTTTQNGKTRKIRLDQKTLCTVIASHPALVADVHSSGTLKQMIADWERLTIDWLKSLYGSDLISVLRHEDEKHWHLHAYILPVSQPDFKAQAFHPGVVAKRAIVEKAEKAGDICKETNKLADLAYKAAMREWQDSYFVHVGSKCGLTRLGPHKRRLTREQWRSEQTQAKALLDTRNRANIVAKKSNEHIFQAKSIATQIRREANILLAQATEKDKIAEARLEEIGKYRKFGSAVRALWDGLRKSKIYKKIESDFAVDIWKFKTAAKALEKQITAFKRQNGALEHKIQELQFENAKISIEHDRAIKKSECKQIEPKSASRPAPRR